MRRVMPLIVICLALLPGAAGLAAESSSEVNPKLYPLACKPEATENIYDVLPDGSLFDPDSETTYGNSCALTATNVRCKIPIGGTLEADLSTYSKGTTQSGVRYRQYSMTWQLLDGYLFGICIGPDPDAN